MRLKTATWSSPRSEDPQTPSFMSGNEAVARGAWEAGLRFAAAYPGTPSTEILQVLAAQPEVISQWAVNEKVALESATGASLGGARAMAVMKHVGVNVASDPLMTLGITGVGGGLVLVSADDPGMVSSQNEQDNRNYARFAGVILLEPSDSDECRELTRRAFDLSEEWDLPVMVRTTTPINHGKGRVRLGERRDPGLRSMNREQAKWVMLPAYARRRRQEQLGRLEALLTCGETLGLHRIESGEGEIGIVTSGVTYQYVKEALPDLPVLKLGLTHPLPLPVVREFAARHPLLLVVEELDPFLEEQLRAAGYHAAGKRFLPRHGTLDANAVGTAYTRFREELGRSAPSVTLTSPLGHGSRRNGSSHPWPLTAATGPVADHPVSEESSVESPDIPDRPPVLCPACPYRGVLRAFRKQERFVFGDIGCYTLGALVPHEAIHFTLCMGASVSAAAGFSKVRTEQKALAVIGDSTFLHSGISGLLDAAYNGSRLTLVILDNCAIAMTGGQGHPGTGEPLTGPSSDALDYEALIRSLGIPRVSTVDPYDGDLFGRTLARDMATDEPTVIIARRPCVLRDPQRTSTPAFVNTAMCTGCLDCLDEGCPALVQYRNPRDEVKVRIDRNLCVGCPDCSQACGPGAISWYPDEFSPGPVGPGGAP